MTDPNPPSERWYNIPRADIHNVTLQGDDRVIVEFRLPHAVAVDLWGSSVDRMSIGFTEIAEPQQRYNPFYRSERPFVPKMGVDMSTSGSVTAFPLPAETLKRALAQMSEASNGGEEMGDGTPVRQPEALGMERARRAIDAILPENTYHGTATGARFWTNRRGSYRVQYHGGDRGPSGATVVFVNEAGGWDVKVPTTIEGLDALVLAMVLSGALDVGRVIEANGPPGVTENGVMVADELDSGGVRVMLSKPIDQFWLPPGRAFAVAAQIAAVAASGPASSNRWRPPSFKHQGGIVTPPSL